LLYINFKNKKSAGTALMSLFDLEVSPNTLGTNKTTEPAPLCINFYIHYKAQAFVAYYFVPKNEKLAIFLNQNNILKTLLSFMSFCNQRFDCQN